MTRALVLDCSVAMAWAFDEKEAEIADEVISELDHGVAYVPNLWRLEISNTLLRAEREKRFTKSDTARFTGFLSELPIRVDVQTDSRALAETLTIARKYGLTAYDAAYLELAIRRGYPIATLDKALVAASKKCDLHFSPSATAA